MNQVVASAIPMALSFHGPDYYALETPYVACQAMFLKWSVFNIPRIRKGTTKENPSLGIGEGE
jgi:hypothetical protein